MQLSRELGHSPPSPRPNSLTCTEPVRVKFQSCEATGSVEVKVSGCHQPVAPNKSGHLIGILLVLYHDDASYDGWWQQSRNARTPGQSQGPQADKTSALSLSAVLLLLLASRQILEFVNFLTKMAKKTKPEKKEEAATRLLPIKFKVVQCQGVLGVLVLRF